MSNKTCLCGYTPRDSPEPLLSTQVQVTRLNLSCPAMTNNAHLNLSCPAVSQICSFILVPSATWTSRAKKSTPTVGSDTWSREGCVYSVRGWDWVKELKMFLFHLLSLLNQRSRGPYASFLVLVRPLKISIGVHKEPGNCQERDGTLTASSAVR